MFSKNNIIAKNLKEKFFRKKIAEVEEVGPFYYATDEQGNDAEANEYNTKVISVFFDSLDDSDKNKFLNELGLKEFDAVDALEAIADKNSSFLPSIDLEEIYLYNSHETDGDVQNCACMYLNEYAAEEAAESYWEDD